MGLSCNVIIKVSFIGHSYNYFFYIIIYCANNQSKKKAKHQMVYCFCGLRGQANHHLLRGYLLLSG